MKIIHKPEAGIRSDGWTYGLASSDFHEFVPGTLYEKWGIAFLYYRPERRLSVSIWMPYFGGWSRNFRIFGPRRLSWER